MKLLVAIGRLGFTLTMFVCGSVVMGAAAFPGAMLCYAVWVGTSAWASAPRALALCVTLAAAYFVYGICLIVLVGVLRWTLRLTLRPAEHPVISLGAMKWFVANALLQAVSITFMEFILLSPLATLLYRLMGARVGRHVQINSRYCADLSLLEIGDHSVIGGHATVIGHSFEGDRLILRPVRIGRNVVIGLNAVVLPGAVIGDGAVVAAGAVVPKNTVIEPGSVYLGTGAVSVEAGRFGPDGASGKEARA